MLLLGACSHSLDAARPRPPLYSPNGEPLVGGRLGYPSCAEAVSGWFRRTDTNGDSAIDAAEYRADALRQFAAMDLDHDGYVTPPELAVARAPFEPPPVRPRMPRKEEADETAAATVGSLFRPRPGPLRREREDFSDEILDTPDPVMVADANLDNRVSEREFLAYAERHFAALDADRNGRLSPAEAQTVCRRRRE